MTTKHVMSLLAACATLAASPLALASEPDSDSETLVIGKRPLNEVETRDFVHRVAQPVDGQLARFQKPVCPRVTGFQPEYEARVADRIKAVAETVDAGAGEEGCATNLEVVVVDDGGEFVTELHRQHPEAFAGLSKNEIITLGNFDGVVRSWTNTELTTSDGLPAGRPSPTAGLGSVKHGYQGSSVHFGDVNVMRVYKTSNLNNSFKPAIVSAWVVLESKATIGKSLTQIADYAALRGLAMMRPDKLNGSEDTILSLFEPGIDAARELTEFDRAYLKSLYRGVSKARQMAEAIARKKEQGAP